MSNILTNNINPRSGNLITIGGANDRVSIAGTLSYEDVTNIDSVGIITAQSGIRVTGGSVGIGTLVPDTLLDIQNNTNDSPTFSSGWKSGSYSSSLRIKGYSDNLNLVTHHRILHNFDGNENNGFIDFCRGGNIYGGYMKVGTNGADRITINDNGNVGVGTDTSLDLGGYKVLTLDGSAGSNVSLRGNTTEIGRLLCDTGHLYLDAQEPTAHIYIRRYTGSAYEAHMEFADNGEISIGGAKPAGRDARLNINGLDSTDGTITIVPHSSKGNNITHFHYGGDGDLYLRPANNSGNVNVLNYAAESDARLKENIEDISYGLSEILQLRPRKFNWIDCPVEHNGFIAQEVEEVIPAFVRESQWKAIDYNSLTATLVKALQEANAKIETLEQRLTDAGL